MKGDRIIRVTAAVEAICRSDLFYIVGLLYWSSFNSAFNACSRWSQECSGRGLRSYAIEGGWKERGWREGEQKSRDDGSNKGRKKGRKEARNDRR